MLYLHGFGSVAEFGPRAHGAQDRLLSFARDTTGHKNESKRIIRPVVLVFEQHAGLSKTAQPRE